MRAELDPNGEQVRASQAEGTAWTKIRRQKTVWRRLKEARGWVYCRPEGPGLQAIGHKECYTQEKATKCTFRLHGGRAGLEAQRPARRWPIGERSKA